MILYDNDSPRKIKEALANGWIVRKTDPDGVERYILTDRGFFQYIQEQGHKKATREYYAKGKV